MAPRCSCGFLSSMDKATKDRLCQLMGEQSKKPIDYAVLVMIANE